MIVMIIIIKSIFKPNYLNQIMIIIVIRMSLTIHD